MALVIYPRCDQCQIQSMYCEMCSIPTSRCMRHSTTRLCKICVTRLCKADSCRRICIPCIKCKNDTDWCDNHKMCHKLCTKCFNLMKCTTDEYCVIQTCVSCNVYLNTCHYHGNMYCDRCKLYKCRVKSCGKLMSRCDKCAVILPVCQYHGSLCYTCHIAELYKKLLYDIKRGYTCYNCYTQLDSWKTCHSNRCDDFRVYYCIPCSKILLTPTRGNNLKCYHCIMTLSMRHRKKPKKVISNKFRQYIMKRTGLTRDTSGIIADYLLNPDLSLPASLPEKLTTNPKYYELCDDISSIKEPINPNKIVIEGYRIKGAPDSYKLVIPSC